MGTFLMMLDVVVAQGEAMVVRHYGKRHGAGGMIFNAIICLFSTLFFVLTDKNGLYFSGEMIVYGAVSSVLFALGFYSMYVAFQLGSYVATKLISSFTGVISIVYGVFWLGETASWTTWLGIVTIFAAMVLMRYQKADPSDKKAVTSKWLFWVLLSVVSNGLISVLSRMQQLHFNNQFDNEFMILSLLGSFVILLVIGIVKERDSMRATFRSGFGYGAAAGLFNGGKNLVNLVIYLCVPISVATPMKTGIGLVVSFLISLLLYKERFNRQQLMGVALGAVALILFKL